ncbi:MAG: asparagine synthase (glutamine-hydrolyzing) [Pseudomonadota bacterium]
MCGISGWIDFAARPADEIRKVLADMVAAMRHRGPDDSGIWACAQGGLGHARLAILDPQHSRQPMLSRTAQGTVALSFSGEVYNFRELRRELTAAGHAFRTDGDTETLLAAYLQWGDECIERLAGMFAFAIWDDRTRRLMLARDRLGVKPLYYMRHGTGLLFGSEPKAIFAHPAIEPAVDADGLRQVFALVRAPGDAVYAGIREVEPGCAIVFDESGLRVRRYWQLESRPHAEDLSGTIERTRDLLSRIIIENLASDVPICALLSGGLDSSTIAAVAHRHLAGQGDALDTASVGFGIPPELFVPDAMRPSQDDAFVELMVGHLGTRHHRVEVSVEGMLSERLHATTLRARDLPGLGEVDATLFLLFSAIRRTFTVAISGEGADELFGGYRWFDDPEIISQHTFPWLAMARGLGRYSMFEPAGAKLDVRSYQADLYADAIRRVPRLDGETASESRMREISYLHLTHFLPTPLERKDRMSMAVGLEVRVPYVDHRLVEYVFNVPWEMKRFDGREKSLLRAVAGDWLPETVLNRAKSAFPALLDAQYHRYLTARMRTILDEGRSPVLDLLQRPTLRTLAAASERQATAVRMGLERAIALHDWLETYRVSIRA